MPEEAMLEHTIASGPPNPIEPSATASVDLALRGPVTQRIDSRRLLAGKNELVIDHAGQEYRLRLTRNDKLILTK
jgi:hemin uptake protein HemP